MRRIALLSLFVLCVIAIEKPSLIQVDTKSEFRHFIDTQGRTRIFHGVNAVYKVAPWHPSTGSYNTNTSLNAHDAQQLREWGFNVVRLGVMWPGWMPKKGVASAQYAAAIDTIVRTLEAQGIHVLLDCHQDLLSRKFCGEGAPDWAVEYPGGERRLQFPLPVGLPLPVNATTHYPPLDLCLKHMFALYYGSEAVGAAFEQLYDPAGAMQRHFVDFWGNVSSKFASRNSVLGYELLNEPWPGNLYLQPKYLKPGVADRELLQPMYDRLAARIRQTDGRHMIFFEKSLVPGQATPEGFQHGPGGPHDTARQVLSYHVYCLPADKHGVPVNEILCDVEDLGEFEVDMLDAYHRLKVGSMMTEFGAFESAKRSVDNLAFLLSLVDGHQQSWTYWQYKSFRDITTQGGPDESFYFANGTLQEPKVKALSRTYPQAIAGEPLSMNFSPYTSRFVLSYLAKASVSAPTIIYLNEKWYYQGGYTVTITPPNAATWKTDETNYIEVHHSASITDGTQIGIVIEKA